MQPLTDGGYLDSSRRWAVFAHLSLWMAFFFPFTGCVVGPVCAVTVFGHHDRGIESEAYEALNAGITMAIFLLIARIIGYATGNLTNLAHYWWGEMLVLAIYLPFAAYAARRAFKQNHFFRYPHIFRLIKPPLPRSQEN